MPRAAAAAARRAEGVERVGAPGVTGGAPARAEMLPATLGRLEVEVEDVDDPAARRPGRVAVVVVPATDDLGRLAVLVRGTPPARGVAAAVAMVVRAGGNVRDVMSGRAVRLAAAGVVVVELVAVAVRPTPGPKLPPIFARGVAVAEAAAAPIEGRVASEADLTGDWTREAGVLIPEVARELAAEGRACAVGRVAAAVDGGG